MTKELERREHVTRLRAQAEVAASVELVRPLALDVAGLPHEVQAMLHDLRVHQIELEMQNDELRRSQAELESERSRYIDLYELAPVGYCTLSEQGLILEANLAAASLLGISREALVAQRFPSFVNRDDQDSFYLVCKGLLKSGAAPPCELRMVKHDGTPCWVRLTLTVGQSEGAGTMRVIIDDISQSKEQAHRLLASEARFRGLIEQSLTGIYMSQDGVFLYANPRLEQILGYEPGALVGLRWPDQIIESDQAVFQAARARLLARETSVVSYEVSARRRDGTVIALGLQGTLSEFDAKPATIGMAQDITEKRVAAAQIARYVQELEAALGSTVEVVTRLGELRDPYTAGHQRRVGALAVAIGHELGLDAHAVEGLRVAGFLHDVGKITVPAEILSKPTKLNAIEYALIKGHPQSGYDVLKDVAFPWPVAQVALQHHERIDGSGYPHGIKGEEIVLEARIMAVADVVEAMASHRPYRASLGIDLALAEVERGRASAYDVSVVDACLKLFREKGYMLGAEF